VAREFWVCEGRETDFERVFGKQGLWAELLQKASGFLGTELSCESEIERRYRTFDYWESHLHFEAFREIYKADRERLFRLVESEKILDRELLLGAFYTGGPDLDDETGLVPA
jgi:heme-degrading monooxygenase HmoA